MVAQKGGPCERVASFMLRRCFLLDFEPSEPSLEDNLSPLPSFGLIFSCVFWAPGFTYGGESLAYFGTQFVAMSCIWVFILSSFLGLSARLLYVF